MLFNKSHTIGMNYGIDFIKQHVEKSPAPNKTIQRDPERRKPYTGIMSTL